MRKGRREKFSAGNEGAIERHLRKLRNRWTEWFAEEFLLALQPEIAAVIKSAMNRKEQEIEALISPTVEALKCQVWGVEYVVQGRQSRLRIYIEKEDGVSVDDCAEVSRHVGDLLEIEETMPSAYQLEVSSPGMDRILFREEHFFQFVGEQVEARLLYPFEGRKKFVGVLAGVEDGAALIQQDEDEYILPLESIQRARIVPTFDK